MLARPNATSRRVDLERAAERAQEHPQRRGVEQPVERWPTAATREQRAVGDQLLQPLADLAQRGGGRVRVEAQLAAEPAQEPLGPALAVLQPDDEQRRRRA